ncbi:MAG: ribbon-helix-helix domain-containing protein, partial [Hyphomicrobiales bacterium]|nr:ribbon-helix-helix domain-containing protein [Hyphomicrobiales bacterium]
MQSPKTTSPIQKRSVILTGHKTSVSLEDEFWTGLKEIASSRQMTVADLVAAIDRDRKTGNLSSALRLYVLAYYRGVQQSIQDSAADV